MTTEAPPRKEHWSARVVARVEKWSDTAAYEAGAAPDEVIEREGNLLLNEGIGEVLDIIGGLGSTTLFDNTNARIGVGDSSTAAAATQTDLQAATNKLYKGMEAGFPTRSGQTLQFKASFGDAEANFAWEEWTVDNGSTAAINLNRKVTSLGTKSSGTWNLTVDITLS